MPMHPLHEVSTERGENMRETCARVLAAALLTGAIATVVGIAALVDTPREPAHSIAAPPSTVDRSVRLAARPLPHHRRIPARLVTTHTSYRAPRPPVVTDRLVVGHLHHARQRPHQRQLAAVPAPAPAAAPTPPPAPAPAPPAASTPKDSDPVVPDTSPGPGNHGRGHAYGHDKQDD